MAMLHGSLATFDSDSFRANIWLDGSPGHVLSGVAVSRGLPSAEMVAGRRILIDTGGQPDPAGFVVIAVVA